MWSASFSDCTLLACVQIFNYVYADDEEDRVIAMFGSAMIYNHREPHTVQHYDLTRGRQRTDPYTKKSPYSLHYKLQFQTLRPIMAGEEIFGDYGDEWFWTRGIDIDDSLDGEEPMRYESMAALAEAGHCLTDIEVKRSTIFGAGDGVFARRAFVKGEIVSISPLVNIPKTILKEIEEDTVLGNYCFSIPESDDAFLPIGTGGMINHGGLPEDENTRVNLKVEWYQWNNNRVILSDKTDTDPAAAKARPTESDSATVQTPHAHAEKGIHSPYGIYDFAYIATRDINVGEELFISYGEEWKTAWEEYGKEKREHHKDHKSGEESTPPIFRHFIAL